MTSPLTATSRSPQSGAPHPGAADSFPQVHAYLAELLADYGPEYAALHASLERLVARGRKAPCEFSLPLLVHGAISGTTEPAVPLAAVHALWWRAANTFDDVADGDAGEGLYGLTGGAALTAALECGYALPLRALSRLPAPEPLRSRLREDYLDTWTTASNGQISDVLNEPAAVTPATVLAVYARKSGSIYAMAGTMAARLALETHPEARSEARSEGAESIRSWGRFGHLLGMLAQFRNDEDDLTDGPCEDLRNRTATYLLVHLMHTPPLSRRERALSLLDGAATSDDCRRQLKAMMREPDVLIPYQAYVHSLADEAYALLDALAPESPYRPALRDLVDAETRFLPEAGTRPEDGTGATGREYPGPGPVEV